MIDGIALPTVILENFFHPPPWGFEPIEGPLSAGPCWLCLLSSSTRIPSRSLDSDPTFLSISPPLCGNALCPTLPSLVGFTQFLVLMRSCPPLFTRHCNFPVGVPILIQIALSAHVNAFPPIIRHRSICACCSSRSPNKEFQLLFFPKR